MGLREGGRGVRAGKSLARSPPIEARFDLPSILSRSYPPVGVAHSRQTHNAVLSAPGPQFGFRRTALHVLGTVVGRPASAHCGSQRGTLLEAVPAVEVMLKVEGGRVGALVV